MSSRPRYPAVHTAAQCGRPRHERVAARVLVVDDRDRLLLFRGCDPAEPAAGSWWFTVGGGVEGDESLPACALRELAEETGIDATADRLVGPVLERDAEFDFLDWHVCSREAFFAVRVPACEVRPRLVTEIERRSVLGHRWWSLAELRDAGELVHPAELADVVSGLLAGGLLPARAAR